MQEYEKPRLEVYGSVAEVTGGYGGSISDGHKGAHNANSGSE